MKEHHVPFTILGNPFHFNGRGLSPSERVWDAKNTNFRWTVMRETHDWFRKPGSFDITLEKIGCINRAAIRSVVMTTVSGTNIDEIPDIIDAVVKAEARVFAFARYCPTKSTAILIQSVSRLRCLIFAYFTDFFIFFYTFDQR